MNILEAWTWPEDRTKRALDGLYKQFRPALAALAAIDDQDARAAEVLVKATYKQLSGYFTSDQAAAAKSALHQPYWFRAMIAKARVAILRQILTTGQSTSWPVGPTPGRWWCRTPTWSGTPRAASTRPRPLGRETRPSSAAAPERTNRCGRPSSPTTPKYLGIAGLVLGWVGWWPGLMVAAVVLLIGVAWATVLLLAGPRDTFAFAPPIMTGVAATILLLS